MTTDPIPKITIRVGEKFGRNREWQAKKLLGQGAFGVVYLVENKRTKQMAALKAEVDCEQNGGSAIKIETAILKKIHCKGLKPHFTELFHSVARRDYHYMIMSRLGKDLRELRLVSNKNGRFSESTCVRVGIQCLYALKMLHDVGYLHRDIKPINFMVGYRSDPDRARIVHLVDFGLARRFASEDKNGNWKMRRGRKMAQFRGTYRYAAPAVHNRIEQGRRDDIYGWFYMVIELLGGLPWEKETTKERIEWKKFHTSDTTLLTGVPGEMHWICQHLDKDLDCYKRPDYARLYTSCERWMHSVGVTHEHLYDWERNEDVNRPKSSSGPPTWYNSNAFFTSDPLQLNGPPRTNKSTLSPPSSVSIR